MRASHRPPYFILVADDNAPVAEMLTELFNDEPGYYAKGVLNPEAALETAQLTHPDLLILDLIFPEEDGLAFYLRVHQMQRLSDVPVLFVTASRTGAHRIRSRGLPVFTKPFDVEDVLAQVDRLVRHAA